MIAAVWLGRGCVEEHELFRENSNLVDGGMLASDALVADEKLDVSVSPPHVETDSSGDAPAPNDARLNPANCPDAAPPVGTLCADAGFSSFAQTFCEFGRQICLCGLGGDPTWRCFDLSGFEGGVCPLQPAPGMPCLPSVTCPYGMTTCVCDSTDDGGPGRWRCL